MKLGIMRTLTFWNRKIIAGSTPTLEATSRIARRFEKSDQRYYFVPCPECDHKQVLRWANLRWEKGKPETVLYHCEGCGVGIGHHQKRRMIEDADRRQRAGETGIGWVASQPLNGHAGFHIWAGYSYAPNAEWRHLAAEWEACQDNIEELKTFINTVLGETWKGRGDAPEWQRLYDRRESYPLNSIPDGALMLFAGADVQKDRIEVEIVAYGRRLNSWSIDYRVFPGDPANIDGADSPWRGLDALLAETWLHKSGAVLSLTGLAVDAGYNTQAVLSWVAKWPISRVIAIKGQETLPMLIGQPQAVSVTVSGKKRSRGVKQWPVGTNMLTTELYGFLKQDRPTEESGLEYPHGYCHFPEYPEEFFRQLTAEEMVTRLVRGYRRHQFEKTRERNETLDCRKYARAFAALKGLDRYTEEQWRNIETALGITLPAPAPEAPKTETVNGVEITRRKSDYWGRGR